MLSPTSTRPMWYFVADVVDVVDVADVADVVDVVFRRTAGIHTSLRATAMSDGKH